MKHKKRGYIFPGQGAQKVGMGKDFYDHYLVSKEVFQEADEILQRSLSKMIFSGDMNELTLTKNCQPALFITSIAILRALEKEIPEIKPSITGGLSLGEYMALFTSKKASFQDTLKLVALRGDLMHKASINAPGALLAGIGINQRDVAGKGFWIANINSPGQIVVACQKGKEEITTEKLKAVGAKKVIPLKVSGAFHSPLMKEAKEGLEPFIKELHLTSSSIDLVMNTTGRIVKDLEEIRISLIDQVYSTTYWLDCMKTMEQNCQIFYEIGPSQLKAMQKKMGMKQNCYPIEMIQDLEKVYETI